MPRANGATKPNRLEHLNRDEGYRFGPGDLRDPDMIEVCHLIDQSGKDINEIIEDVLDVSNNSVHISYGTVYHWLHGPTRRPQNHTLTWVLRALGKERLIVNIKD